MGFGDGVSNEALPPFGRRTDEPPVGQGRGGGPRQAFGRGGFGGRGGRNEGPKRYNDNDNRESGFHDRDDERRPFDGGKRDRGDDIRSERFGEGGSGFGGQDARRRDIDFGEKGAKFGRDNRDDGYKRNYQSDDRDNRRGDSRGFRDGDNDGRPFESRRRFDEEGSFRDRRGDFSRDSDQNRPPSGRGYGSGRDREYRKEDLEYFEHDRRESKGFRSDDPREYQSNRREYNAESSNRDGLRGGVSRGPSEGFGDSDRGDYRRPVFGESRGGLGTSDGRGRNSDDGFGARRGDRGGSRDRFNDDRGSRTFGDRQENGFGFGGRRQDSSGDQGRNFRRDDSGFFKRRDDDFGSDFRRDENRFGDRRNDDRRGFGNSRDDRDFGSKSKFGTGGFGNDRGFNDGGKRGFDEGGGSGFGDGSGFGNRNTSGFGSGFGSEKPSGFGGPKFDGGRSGFNDRNSSSFGGDRNDRNQRGYREYYAGGPTEGKKRAPRDWNPDVVSVETLFERDARNAGCFQKELDDPVTIEGDDGNCQINNWENSGLNPQLIKTCVEKCKYTFVRPIQAATIPLILKGKDLMGHAETGGGKTAAFVLPILHYIMNLDTSSRESNGGRILALVVAPTRELAKQLFDSFRKHAFETDIKCCVAYGEKPKWKNLEEIHRGCDVLVGTSGRLMDYVLKGDINVTSLKFLVLDEADMLLSDGRDSHLESILNDPKFPPIEKRQTLLFSATFPPEIEKLAGKVLKKNYVKVSNGAKGRANTRVTQQFLQAEGVCGKNDALFGLLEEQRDKLARDGTVMRTLIFVGTKKQADFVALRLADKGIKAASINGDRPQDERERVIKQFREGEVVVLVGTDVCQRGLDIPALEQVINYDMPSGSPEEARDKYIHRIGRTGRLYNGVAITFVDSHSTDRDIVNLMCNVAKETGQEVPPWLEEMGKIDSFSRAGFGADTAGSNGFGGGSNFGGGCGFGGSGFGGGGFGGAGEGFGSGGGFGEALVMEKKGGFGSGGFESKLEDKEGERRFGGGGFASGGFGEGGQKMEKKSSGGFGSSNEGEFGSSGFGSDSQKMENKRESSPTNKEECDESTENAKEEKKTDTTSDEDW